MATLIAETKYHGNPRPVLSYSSTVFDEAVASPYYKDGRDVPVYNHYVTPVPLADLAPVATATIAGPAATVAFTMDGLWLDPTTLTVLITSTGGVNFSEVVAWPTTALGPVEAAARMAALITASSGDMTATSDGVTVSVFVVAPSTALTITTLTVA